MTDCTRVLLEEIADRRFKQKDIALTYSLAMRSHHAKADTVDWGSVNRAIIARWSMSGLERIKKMAHDFIAGKRQP